MFLFLLLIQIFFSCSQEENSPLIIAASSKSTSITSPQPDSTEIEKSIIKAGLINIQEIDSSILVNLKYSSEDNLFKADVYGEFSKAYLQPDVAQKLKLAQQYLKQEDSSLTLLIYDAARPLAIA
jgi:D-alanyl-D-alanine dipeptidase